MITQEELIAFQQAKCAYFLYKDLHQSIADRLECGDLVEPGSLNVTLDPTPKKRLSFKSLSSRHGTAFAQKLLSEIEPTVCRYLIVQNSDISTNIQDANSVERNREQDLVQTE